MKNNEIRKALEAELLRLGKVKKPLSKSDYGRYYACLLSLFSLDKSAVSEQGKIYTAAYGNIGSFVSEFSEYVSPLLKKQTKKIIYKNVLDRRTNIFFSPRLTEIALGCLFSIFLSNTDTTFISVFATKTHIAITVRGKSSRHEESEYQCIKKIAELHSGRVIRVFYGSYSNITLAFPLLSRLEPIRIIPSSPTLCRLCRI